MAVASFSIPDLAQRIELSLEVKRRVISADTQSFIIAVIVILGGGYALAFAPSVDQNVKLVLAGFIGAVVQFFFQNKTAATTAASTIAAQAQGSSSSQTASAQGSAQSSAGQGGTGGPGGPGGAARP